MKFNVVFVCCALICVTGIIVITTLAIKTKYCAYDYSVGCPPHNVTKVYLFSKELEYGNITICSKYYTKNCYEYTHSIVPVSTVLTFSQGNEIVCEFRSTELKSFENTKFEILYHVNEACEILPNESKKWLAMIIYTTIADLIMVVATIAMYIVFGKWVIKRSPPLL